MNRYIDVDKLIDKMNEVLINEKHKGNEDTVAYFAFTRIIQALRQEPTADVKKVKYARWRCVDESDNVYMCDGENGCGGELMLNEGTPIDNAMIHCPFCGARMQKEKEE